MNALALVTRGMVSPPFQAMQKCLAIRDGLVRPVSVKPIISVAATARISLQKKDHLPIPLVAQVKPKPTIKAKVIDDTTVKISVKDTAPAPAPSSPSSSPAPSKPTVTVKKNGNGNGHKPKLQVKKKT